MSSPTFAFRSLTPAFTKFRNEHKQRKHRFGYSLLKAPESLHDSGYVSGPPKEVELTVIGSSSPSWASQIVFIKQEMEVIKEKNQTLQKTQQRRLLKVFDDASGKESLADAEIELVGSEITRLFRSCETKIKKIDISGANDAREAELRRNSQRALASKLSHLNEDTRTIQKSFMKEVKRRQAMMGSNGLENSQTSSLLDAAFTDSQALALESIEAEAEQRSNEINKIAKSVAELNRLFKELASFVIDQGTILDRIDYNIENVQEHTKQATVQLQRAEEQQKSGNATKCIFVLILLIFFNLFILSIK